MLEVWETRSSGEKSLTGFEQKNIQYILFKKCTLRITIRMIGGPNGAIKLCSAAAPVKRQVVPHFLIITFITFQISKTYSDPQGRFIICDLTVNGGLKMIDIASFNKSLKATWIQKQLDPENRSKWKRLFDSELERNHGGEAILRGNLNKKDVNNLKISDPFVKEILVIWSEVCVQETIVSEQHLLSSPLWQNYLI